MAMKNTNTTDKLPCMLSLKIMTNAPNPDNSLSSIKKNKNPAKANSKVMPRCLCFAWPSTKKRALVDLLEGVRFPLCPYICEFIFSITMEVGSNSFGDPLSGGGGNIDTGEEDIWGLSLRATDLAGSDLTRVDASGKLTGVNTYGIGDVDTLEERLSAIETVTSGIEVSDGYIVGPEHIITGTTSSVYRYCTTPGVDDTIVWMPVGSGSVERWSIETVPGVLDVNIGGGLSSLTGTPAYCHRVSLVNGTTPVIVTSAGGTFHVANDDGLLIGGALVSVYDDNIGASYGPVQSFSDHIDRFYIAHKGDGIALRSSATKAFVVDFDIPAQGTFNDISTCIVVTPTFTYRLLGFAASGGFGVVQCDGDTMVNIPSLEVLGPGGVTEAIKLLPRTIGGVATCFYVRGDSFGDVYFGNIDLTEAGGVASGVYSSTGGYVSTRGGSVLSVDAWVIPDTEYIGVVYNLSGTGASGGVYFLLLDGSNSVSLIQEIASTEISPSNGLMLHGQNKTVTLMGGSSEVVVYHLYTNINFRSAVGFGDSITVDGDVNVAGNVIGDGDATFTGAVGTGQLTGSGGASFVGVVFTRGLSNLTPGVLEIGVPGGLTTSVAIGSSSIHTNALGNLGVVGELDFTTISLASQQVIDHVNLLNRGVLTHAQLDADIGTLQTDVGTLQTNQGTLISDVFNLQTDVGILQTDVGNVEVDVGFLQTDVQDLQTDVGTLQTDVTNLEAMNVIGGIYTPVNSAYVGCGVGVGNTDCRWSRVADTVFVSGRVTMATDATVAPTIRSFEIDLPVASVFVTGYKNCSGVVQVHQNGGAIIPYAGHIIGIITKNTASISLDESLPASTTWIAHFQLSYEVI